jgi:hypothetical protein
MFGLLNFKINKIDQDVFDSLPQDIQIELLMNYKESLKRNKAKKPISEFPEVCIKTRSELVHGLVFILTFLRFFNTENRRLF